MGRRVNADSGRKCFEFGLRLMVLFGCRGKCSDVAEIVGLIRDTRAFCLVKMSPLQILVLLWFGDVLSS